MATRGGKTRRGKSSRYRDTSANLGYAGESRNMAILAKSGTPFALAAGVYGKVELVTSDLSRLDVICPRAVGKYELVPRPEATPDWK